MKTKVYVLRHPVTLEIRYVGKTVAALSLRLSNHISDAKRTRGRGRYVVSWIKGLCPLRPIIELVCEVDGDGSAQEQVYIKFFRDKGCRLTNLTDGGEGIKGCKLNFTAEHRAKISAAKMGHKVSDETRAKLRAALKGRTIPPEIRAKVSASLIGNKRSVGRKHSPTTRARMSAAHKGRKRRALNPRQLELLQ